MPDNSTDTVQYKPGYKPTSMPEAYLGQRPGTYPEYRANPDVIPYPEMDFTEALKTKITPALMKKLWLFGIPLANGQTGEEMDDDVLSIVIDLGYDYIEKMCDICILPRVVHDDKVDFYYDETIKSCFRLTPNRTPIMFDFADVQKYPVKVRTFLGGGTGYNFPIEQTRVYSETGQIHLYPTTRTGLYNTDNRYPAGQFYNIFGLSFVPQFFTCSYCAGFEKIPHFINAAVAKAAVIYILNPLGDVLLGAGIASQSVSLDGMSESISTTQSAMYGAYSARIEMYKKELKDEINIIIYRYNSGVKVG